ncbi:Anthranilate phosphoribosyltransferase [Abeliophyllum distichum]|uniref:Anthranilate phosphoribosyltransferase n=1 Tax=Abeliophyllum distichum TaxID=126358 RepID=A0ABD1U4M6_9LAMI
MKSLINSDSILSPIPALKIKPQTVFQKPSFRLLTTTKNCGLSIKAVLYSATVDDELGLSESHIRNPAISTTYRNPKFRRPNQTVLEAQTKVCTGPTQTKPLNEEQAFKVLDTILRSVKGELKDEEKVSEAQLGAFFAAMTIRVNTFPGANAME